MYVALNVDGSQHINSYIILSFEQQPNCNSIKFLPKKLLLVHNKVFFSCYCGQFVQINV